MLPRILIQTWRHLNHMQGRRFISCLRPSRSCLQQFPKASSSTSLRYTHSYVDANTTSVVAEHADHLELAHGNQSTKVHYFWLRDHCRCSSCWNSKTSQKNVRFQDIDPYITPAEFHVKEEELVISWPDGHKSSYSIPWLLENDPKNALVPKIKKTLWNGENFHNLNFERVKYKDFLNEDECLKTFFKNFAQFGFAFVDEVPPDLEHTQKVTERVGHIHETIFGRMWTLEADGSRGDTAYTNIALGAHTDMTYYQHTTGIQIFHCVYHDGEGGETLMEDGFYCAKKLQDTNPEAYDYLTKTYVHHDYVEPTHGQHMQSLATVIGLHPLTKEIEQFRYNNYDRIAVKTIPVDEVTKFYSSVNALSDIVEDESNVHWEKLWPGSVYFVDNWRVMHGRKAFTGKRVICGNYIAMDTWTSRARSLGVI